MYITIVEGKAKLSEQGKALPVVKRVHRIDRTKGKRAFESWMRFVYYAYDKESIYKNYLPKEREKKVVESIFPDRNVTYFKTLAGMKALIDDYIERSYTFKELLYRRLLGDVEEMLERLSKIELTKSVRVKATRDVTFYSPTEKKEITEHVPIDVVVKVDNSEEKIKAMDTLDKLLKREVVLKKALKEEQIEADLEKASQKRMFDN